jgi:hypothetical protein
MPVFQYQDYRNPYGPSIAEALQRQADPQAAGALRAGDIAAQAAQQRGALRAQQFGELGAIPGAIQAQRAAAQQIALRQQQAALQGQQLALGGLQLDEAKREQRSRQIFEAESQNPAHLNPDGTINEDKFLAALRVQDVGAWQKAVALKQANQQASLDWMKGLADIDASTATADDKRAAALKLRQDYLGTQALSAYTGLQEKPDDPLHARDWALGLAAKAVADQAVSPGVANQWIRQLAGANPDQVGAALLSAVPPEMKAKYDKEQADAAQARAAADKTPTAVVNGQVVNTQTGAPIGAAVPPQVKPGEGQRVINGQLVGPAGERIGAPVPKQVDPTAAADKTELSPAGLDAAALMYAKTGVLPPLGMGDKTTRKQIINRAAEMIPGLDIASSKADFAANTQSLQAMQKQRDAIGAFEQTARKNIDIFLDAAGKIVDTGSPLANSLVRQITGKMLGSPDQAAYDAARQVAVNEIAKIVSNPTLAGTLSDSARHEVEAFNPGTATLAQSVRVMRLLKQDMDNRTSALDDAIAGIKGRISKGAPDAGGKVKILSITPVP